MAPPNRIPGVRVAQADENYSPSPVSPPSALRQNFNLIKKLHQQISCAEGKEALEFAVEQLQEKQKADRREFINRFAKWKEASCFLEDMKAGLVSQVVQVLSRVEPRGVVFQSFLAVLTSGATISESPQIPSPTVIATKERSIPTGTIRGWVKDARTQEPIKDALIEFVGRNVNDTVLWRSASLTLSDGTFESHRLPLVEVDVEVSKYGYKPAAARLRIVEGRATKIDVLLAPATPPIGIVGGRVVDEYGRGVAAEIKIEGPRLENIQADPTGEFSDIKLPPGEYVVKFVAPDHLVKHRPLSVREGEKYIMDVTLRRIPHRWTARLTSKQIIINRQIGFRTNENDILPETFFILEQVADILLKNPHLKVQIEGHTDNRGFSEKTNFKLSQDRADSVKAYLVQAGVSSDRLDAVGYGASRPLVPNITERNRARNRRIVFNIIP